MDKEINKEILIQRIEQLCAEHKIKPTVAYTESGVGKNFKSNLSKANPSLGKITVLANYFDVSVEYLTGASEEKKAPEKKDGIMFPSADTLSKDESKLLLTYKILTEEGKKKAVDYLDDLATNPKYKSETTVFITQKAADTGIQGMRQDFTAPTRTFAAEELEAMDNAEDEIDE